MKTWWNGMNGFEHVLFIIAAAATVLLVIQIVLLLIGFADDGDFDFDDDGVSLFTLKGMTSFFAIGGWTGLVISTSGGKTWLAVVIALVAGLAAFVLIGFLMRQMVKMQSQGNIELENAVGKTATVYVSIPENMTGKGKVVLTLQERYTELDAMTKEQRKLKTDEIVEIDSLIDDTVIVSSVKKEEIVTE